MMQTVQPSQPHPENKCPDCLYMELTGKPKITSSKVIPEKVSLELTINFNEQWEAMPGGRVKFGLRSGELRLGLTNGAIPFEARELAGKLALQVEKERLSGITETAQKHRSISVGISCKAGLGKDAKASDNAKASDDSKTETSTSQSDKFIVTACQVTTKGAPDNPAWVFEVQTNEPVLKGLLPKKLLATMNVFGSNWQVIATLEVPTLKDVKVTEADGPWLRNANVNKRTAFELGLAKLLLKHKLMPYLSRTIVGHE